MSFGITSLKKKSVKDSVVSKTTVDFIITGEDFATCLLFCKLVKAHGTERVIWLKSYIEKSEQIMKKWEHFSFLSVETVEFDKVENYYFYKDQQFKDFGGRSQPQEMTKIEKSLVGAPRTKSWRELINEHGLADQWEHFDQLVESCVKEAEVASVLHGEPNDLIEANLWGVLTTKGELYLTSDLYWCRSSKSLRSLMDRKSLTVEEIDIIEVKADAQAEIPGFVVHYNFKKSEKLELPSERVIIPVSQSQEQGHFVGMITEESASFFYHFQETLDVTKDKVAKRLKKLKRNLERILKTTVFNQADETIYYSSILFYISEESEDLEKPLKNLHFLSTQSSRKNLLLDKIDHLKSL